MSEWLKEHAWKACVGETLPWVRIPLSPPAFRRRPADVRELEPRSRKARRLKRVAPRGVSPLSQYLAASRRGGPSRATIVRTPRVIVLEHARRVVHSFHAGIHVTEAGGI